MVQDLSQALLTPFAGPGAVAPSSLFAAANPVLIVVDMPMIYKMIVALLLLNLLFLIHRSSTTPSRRRMSSEVPRISPPPENSGSNEENARRVSRKENGQLTVRSLASRSTLPMRAPVVLHTETVSLLPLQLGEHVLREMDVKNPAEAAPLWERAGRWMNAARSYERAERFERAADIYVALGAPEKALPHLRKILENSPKREDIRLRIIEALLDSRNIKDAEILVEPLSAPDSPVTASARFYELAGRDFEAIGENDRAEHLYRLSLSKGPAPELEIRLQSLKQMARLRGVSDAEASGSAAATELLDKYIRESSAVSVGATKDDFTDAMDLRGHDIMVGHLALGFQESEPPHSVRSIFSLSRRFSLQRQLAESKRAAVFEATDQLLDCPVAVKLIRLPINANSIAILKARLHAVGQLNHPNLAKMMFADRDGPVLRIVTEYLPGGNLHDFLVKLGGVGPPLLIRMAMNLASGLHTAHLRGVPHGDLRPENILIGSDQRVKLTDFALSAIPVREIDFQHPTNGDGVDLEDFDQPPANEGVQSDLLQFGELLEFMIGHIRKTAEGSPIQKVDPTDELRELVGQLRRGGFTSVLRLFQVLERILERTMPAAPAPSEASRPAKG
ncbi:hypothetical protein BH09SUM1_BH09SUM1_09590 [soil metagenome]